MSLASRIKKRYKHLKKWAKRQKITAYRLYDRDIPEYPYIVEIYNDFAAISLRLNDKDIGKEDHITELFDVMTEIGYPKNKCFVRKRQVNKGKDQYQKNKSKEFTTTVEELDLKFKVNLTDYLDTGLFLDHRNWRNTLAGMDLKDSKVLNLFCYTGSLSVAMAYAGAKVTSVDLNPNYIEWAKENFELNDLNVSAHQWHATDCLNFLKEDEASGRNLYDLIVIDPPSYSVSKKFKGTFDIQRDHIFILSLCHKLLVPGGTCFFSTNLRSFKIDESLQERLQISETSHKSIPEDFHDKKIHRSYTWTKESQ